jgi:hypothetical protein
VGGGHAGVEQLRVSTCHTKITKHVSHTKIK